MIVRGSLLYRQRDAQDLIHLPMDWIRAGRRAGFKKASFPLSECRLKPLEKREEQMIVAHDSTSTVVFLISAYLEYPGGGVRRIVSLRCQDYFF